MRFFFIGPRILGIRPGISFGLNELLRIANRPKQRPAEPMTGSFLHVIRGDHNMVKIGVSTNPNARLASLRTASAFPIDFSYIAVTPGTGFDIEAGAHEMLKGHRCSGEWFDGAGNGGRGHCRCGSQARQAVALRMQASRSCRSLQRSPIRSCRSRPIAAGRRRTTSTYSTGYLGRYDCLFRSLAGRYVASSSMLPLPSCT
jgi:hypothetical protein